MKSALVIQIKQIGDCILTQPILKNIKENFPNCRTGFVVAKNIAPLFKYDPYIDEVICYDYTSPVKTILNIRKKKYEVAFDFLSNPRSRIVILFSGAKKKVGFKKRHSNFFYNIKSPSPVVPCYIVEEKLYLLKALNLNTKIFIPKLYIKEAERKKACSFLNDLTSDIETFIGLAPYSRRGARRWHREGFLKVINEVRKNIDKKSGVIIFVSKDEREYADYFVNELKDVWLCPVTDLREIAALIGEMDVLVGCDNGLKHIAVGLEVPTVAIHLANKPVSWTPPDSTRYTYVWTSAECRGCEKRECPDMICHSKVNIREVVNKTANFLI